MSVCPTPEAPAAQCEPVQADHLAEALRQVVGHLVRKVRSEAQTPSNAQTETLGFIERHGPASISAMARHRHVKHQSMRLVIDQLETQQLISRAPDPSDGRKQLIGLTANGRAALQHSRDQRSHWLAKQLAGKTNAAELQTLRSAVAILERLLD